MASYFLDSASPTLDASLRRLLGLRLVFFAGMPGTGKSLLVHQLAHLAHREGRRVHLLQWDVARPAIETSEGGRLYPPKDHISHPIVRQATSAWARTALAQWAASAAPADLLIGETPLIGGRFHDLVRRQDDASEAILTSTECRFVLAVPSDDVRRHIMAERRRRFETPLHEREREDAPPDAMRDMWLELLEAAESLGVSFPLAAAAGDYDADTYRRTYQRILQHSRLEVLEFGEVLPTASMSVYDISVPVVSLTPTEDEAASFIRQAAAAPSTRPWWDV